MLPISNKIAQYVITSLLLINQVLPNCIWDSIKSFQWIYTFSLNKLCIFFNLIISITQRDIITNLGNIILLYKLIMDTTSPHKTQHSHLYTFRFIAFRYMFRSITLTTIKQEKNISTKGKWYRGGLLYTTDLLRCINITPQKEVIKDPMYSTQ